MLTMMVAQVAIIVPVVYLPERQQTATVQRRNRTRTDDASWSRLME